MGLIYIFQSDYTCSVQSKLLTATNNTSITIQAAVGNAAPPRCRNNFSDVTTIQKALNRFSPIEGGPSTPLVVDGICGNLTKKAIYHFQQKWDLKPKGWQVPDGIVDPNGATIHRLSKGSGTSAQNLPLEFAERIPRVMQIITATRTVLTMAKSYYTMPKFGGGLPSLGSFGKTEADKLERHFHVSKKANPVNRLEEVDRIFFNMQVAIGYVPQGVVLAMDEPPDTAVSAFMFTFEGGYYRRNNKDTSDGISTGSIYLCPKSRTVGQEGFAYIMIHELAHYVGPMNFGITDIAYFRKTPQVYRNLGPDETFHNADNYAQFAFDAIGKLDFDPTAGNQ